MRDIKQSTARDVLVFMTDSSDHVTGKTGLTLTITASKAAAAFASITPTVTERGSGWYALALTSSHTDTLGDLGLHITATGADPADLLMNVTVNILGDVATAAALATVSTNVDAIPTNAELATALASADDAVLAAIAALSIPTADANADALLDRTAAIEAGVTFRQAMRLIVAAEAGKLSGAAGTTITIRDLADTKDRLVATVDTSGNRTAVTRDLT